MKLLAIEFLKQIARLKKIDRVLIVITAAFMLLLSLVDAGALSLLSTTLKGSSSQSLMKHAPILVLIVFLFILKSLLSALITYWSMRHFEKIEFLIGSKNVEQIRNASWFQVRNLSAVDLTNLFDKGPNSIARSLLFSGALFVAESLTALAITFVLLKENFVSSIVGLIFFAGVVLVQNRLLGRLSESSGRNLLMHSNEVQRRTLEIAHLGKLLKVSESTGLYGKLNSHRKGMINSRNTSWYLGSVPRYYMEAVLAAGLVIVAATTYLLSGAESIFSSLSLFAAAGYRLLPTVNRMQGYALDAVSALPYIKIDKELLGEASPLVDISQGLDKAAGETLIALENVSFRFEDSQENVLNNISLKLARGKTYALVGPSGSGKTTLADVFLGLLKPQSGAVRFAEKVRLAYVPQETTLIVGTLSENVTLGEPSNDRELQNALSFSELLDLEKKLQDFEMPTLSGGQRQRIGLARAIYRKADFTVLDEATSALDNSTESRVVENLRKIRSTSTTYLIIAHRLSTVKDADELIFMDKGKILGVGSWDELISKCPPFKDAVELGSLLREDSK